MDAFRTWIPAVLAIALFAAAAGTWFGYGGNGDALRDEGMSTDASVVSITMSAGEITRYGQQTPARYYVTYRFMDSIGTPREGMTNGTGIRFADLAVGETIPVRYLPRDPGVSVYETGESLGGQKPVRLVAAFAVSGMAASLFALVGFRRWPRGRI